MRRCSTNCARGQSVKGAGQGIRRRLNRRMRVRNAYMIDRIIHKSGQRWPAGKSSVLTSAGAEDSPPLLFQHLSPYLPTLWPLIPPTHHTQSALSNSRLPAHQPCPFPLTRTSFPTHINLPPSTFDRIPLFPLPFIFPVYNRYWRG